MNTRTTRDSRLSDADESTPMTRVITETLDGEASSTSFVHLDDGGVLLTQRISAVEWAVLAPLVAARAPDVPLVSHLDTAGMRDCLRDAAVDSEGD